MDISRKENIPIKGLIFNLFKFISKRRKIQLLLLIGLFILSSLAETLSLAAVAPYLYYITKPLSFYNIKFVERFFNFFKISPEGSTVLLFLTILIISITLISAAIRIVNLWLIHKVSFGIGKDLGKLSFRNVLLQNYSYHISAKSHNIIATIGTDINVVIANILGPIIQSLASIILIFGIAVALLIISPIPTLITIMVIIISFFFFIKKNKYKLRMNSDIQTLSHRKIIKAIQDGLGNIKNIILTNSQHISFKEFSKYDSSFRNAQIQNAFLTSYTKLILEPSIISLLVISGYIMAIIGQENQLIPILGVFALGSQKTLPFMQKVYEGIATASGSTKNLANVLELISLSEKENIFKKEPLENFNFKKINLKNVSFSYDNKTEILKNICIDLNAGECIGFIGKTGSGKSTLIDIINSLLVPQKGNVFINGIDINKKENLNLKRLYRKAISYVPQNIYLSDESILSNITFGKPLNTINKNRLDYALESSQSKEFIYDLPNKLNTLVGERGIKLSGGQRQRIGIARALYNQSEILILDEATNSLDIDTEQKLISSLLLSKNRPLIIMIAHRLRTLKKCNKVYELKKGIIINQTSGKEFINS